MMTVTVATAATVRKLKSVSLNVGESDNESDQEGIIEKESSKPCHVHIVKFRICLRLRWLSAPDVFGHDNNSICPICGYGIPVDKEHIKVAFARCNDCG